VGEPNHIFLTSVDGTPYAMEQTRGGLLDVVAVAQPLDLYANFGALDAKA
jgi:ribose transport system substrate-binding protein